MNAPHELPMTINGAGNVTPPPGLTEADMERLAREADEANNKET
jgi:hypothetical protein